MNIMEHILSINDTKILEIIKQNFFVGNPVVIDIELEGQRLDDQRNIILGCRAGPSLGVDSLLHEMAHLAQLEEKRIAKRPFYNWDFDYGKHWEISGQSGYEAQTDQSVLRERDVWAYQFSLLKHYGISCKDDHHDEEESEIYALVSSVVYMEAFFLYCKKVVPQEIEDYKEREELGIQHLAKEVESLSQSVFAYEKFCEEWNKRMELLKVTYE